MAVLHGKQGLLRDKKCAEIMLAWLTGFGCLNGFESVHCKRTSDTITVPSLPEKCIFYKGETFSTHSPYFKTVIKNEVF